MSKRPHFFGLLAVSVMGALVVNWVAALLSELERLYELRVTRED